MKPIAFSTAALVLALATTAPAGAQPADVLYVGGDVVTVNDAQPTAEAVAVKDGRILAVGARAEIEKAHKGATTKAVDLAGRTLAPGFVDAHATSPRSDRRQWAPTCWRRRTAPSTPSTTS